MSENLKNKKWLNTVKFIAAYLVAAWTFLQFVDWILNRYEISPHWVDILLWTFIGLIPSLIIYLQHKDRINKRVFKLKEKILIPLNIILLAVALYFGFGNSDLGATTKKINYTDEEGKAQTKIITKEEFRIGVPVYGFENLTKNDSLSWLRYGIGSLIAEDLSQNKSLSPDFEFFTDTSTKIQESSLFNDFYIDGDYQKNENNYTIKVYKRKSTNGKILKENTFTGSDILTLIDDISVFITENSGFVETKNLRYLDYPINEFMSDSLEAIKEYFNGNYSKAVSIDDKFALAYLKNAQRSLRFSKGKLEIKDLSDKAFKYRYRLPLQKQLEVYIQRNLAYENFDEAAEQVKLQLEVDPHNMFYNQVLFSIYGETKQTDKFLKSSERLFDIDQKPETGTNLANAAMVSGNDDMLINEIKKYEIISPSLKVFRLQPLLLKGDIKKAAGLLEEMKTLFPNYKFRAQVYDSAVNYLKNNKYDINQLKKFEGSYRSNFNEQILTFWIDNDRLIKYTKNQSMEALIQAGDNSAVTGFVNNTTYKYDLVYNDLGKPIGIRSNLYNYKNMNSFWYWKIDETITNANEAFDQGDFEVAQELYQIAIDENPEHDYLKNNLQHISYVKKIGVDSLTQQHKRFAGEYGPRLFWVEDGKFFYKRKSENVDLPRFEMLAIDENTYMDLTRSNTLMKFVEDPSGKLASSSIQYIIDEKKWIPSDNVNTTNYFLKDD